MIAIPGLSFSFLKSRESAQESMVFIWLLFQVSSGSLISILPEKLRLYQNVTGIDDFKLNQIFKQYLEGELNIK